MVELPQPVIVAQQEKHRGHEDSTGRLVPVCGGVFVIVCDPCDRECDTHRPRERERDDLTRFFNCFVLRPRRWRLTRS